MQVVNYLVASIVILLTKYSFQNKIKCIILLQLKLTNMLQNTAVLTCLLSCGKSATTLQYK